MVYGYTLAHAVRVFVDPCSGLSFRKTVQAIYQRRWSDPRPALFETDDLRQHRVDGLARCKGSLLRPGPPIHTSAMRSADASAWGGPVSSRTAPSDTAA